MVIEGNVPAELLVALLLGLAVLVALSVRDRSGPAGTPRERPALPRSGTNARARQTPRRMEDRPAAEIARRGYPVIGPPPGSELRGKCWVIDGDTVRIGQTKIRLAGIDAPELDMPWGRESKWAMIQLCRGQIVRAVLTGEQSYDRLVATCYLPDGRDIGAELIRQGLALDYGLFSGGRYRHLEPPGTRAKLKQVYLAQQRQA